MLITELSKISGINDSCILIPTLSDVNLHPAENNLCTVYIKADDKNFKITTSEGESLKPDYSQNWPYDYFSLIELAKIDGGITIVPKKKEEDEE